MSADEKITVVIPTSPIPSCPSTAIIEKTIASVRESLPLAWIIVTCDGAEVQNESYSAYVDALSNSSDTIQVAWFHPHVHQSGMLATALHHTKTPLLLYVEHDWELLPDIPWGELSDLILSGELNSIKLHANPRVSVYHEHLMESRVVYQQGKACDRYQDNLPGPAVPIIRTRQWSQNPHLASTEFYRSKILPLCEGKCDFIENIVHGIVGHSPWSEYKTGIYNPPTGDMMRVRHLDGRGTPA